MTALKEVMEGKPVRSPLHPALVHLPIALFPISVVLDVLSRVWDSTDAPLVEAAFISLVAGLATALLAAVFGFVDYSDIRDDHPAKKTATAHLILNLIAVGLFAGSAGLRFGALDEPAVGTLPLVVSLAGLAVLGYSGFLGGKLVYDEGIGVGRHRQRTRALPPTIVVKSKAGEPLAVAKETELREGETLRVEVDGVAMTLARVEGRVCAVQDFCTHRYAPLSEGQVKGCEVTCPWHRSRFDLRTGKVTAGPAKVDLRTFKAESRDGKIWVSAK